MPKRTSGGGSSSSSSNAPKPMTVRPGVSTSRRRYEGGGKTK